MGWLITRDPNGGFTRVFAHGLGLPLMDVVLDLARINPKETRPSVYKSLKVKQPRGRPATPANHQRRDEMRVLFAEGKTKAEIGKIYGISRERVRQIIGSGGTGIATKIRHENMIAQIEKMADTSTVHDVAKSLGVSQATLSKVAPGRRYKIVDENSSVGKGDKWENIISDKLTEFGIKNKLMPRLHPFDILAADKIRIDVKSRNSVTDKTGSCFYNVTIRKPGNCDFIVACIEDLDEFYIIPVNENSSCSIRIQSPQKRASKYEKYKNAWHLIANAVNGEKIEPVEKRFKGERRHGTMTSYGGGCRCELCKQAARDNYRANAEKNRDGRVKPYAQRLAKGLNHGTSTAYSKYKCRCDLCKQFMHDYYISKKSTTPAPSA